ncbi:hypothetical protein O181_119953, partial [Austropuccinia psidii MF-1]|nr:hypothetical protein [Austropuccinia psidii MF-1]
MHHVIQRIHQGSRQTVNLKYQCCHQAIIGYSNSQYSSNGILAVHSQGIFQRQFQNNFPRVSAPSIHLGNHIHSIQSGFIKTCISIINHGNVIQSSQIPNLARYTLHQAIKYSFKDSIQTS